LYWWEKKCFVLIASSSESKLTETILFVEILMMFQYEIICEFDEKIINVYLDLDENENKKNLSCVFSHFCEQQFFG
jgi:hypothetical protein